MNNLARHIGLSLLLGLFLSATAVEAVTGFAYDLRHRRLVYIIDFPHSQDRDERVQQDFEELRRITNDDMAHTIEAERTGRIEEYYTPLVNDGRIEPTRESGKDYLLDSDGTIRIWDEDSARYVPWKPVS